LPIQKNAVIHSTQMSTPIYTLIPNWFYNIH